MLTTLKQKLLALVLFSIGGTLLVAGFALSVLIDQRHTEDNRRNLQAFFDRSASELQDLLRNSARSRDELRSREEIRETLYLITAYAKADDYQALIFDEEKKKLSQWLLNHARSSNDSQISIYDDQGVLVAFAKRLPKGSLRGIVTYSEGNPQILVNQDDDSGNGEWRQPPSESQRDLPAIFGLPGETGSWFTTRGETISAYSLDHLQHRFADGRRVEVGSIHVERHVDTAFLKSISHRFNGHFSLITPYGHRLGDDLGLDDKLLQETVPDLFTRSEGKGPWQDPGNPSLFAYKVELSGGDRFYLAATVDSTPAQSQAGLIQNVAIGVFLVAALVLLPFVLWFAHRMIIGPIQRLEASAHALGKGDYDIEVPACGSEEVDNLAKTLLETARVVRSRELQLRHHSESLEQQVADRTSDLTKVNTSLTNSQRMLQLVMDNIPQYVFWKDRHSHYLGCNANFLKASGKHSVSELVGLTDYDLPWSREEAESYRQIDQEVMDADEPRYKILESILTATGEEKFVDTNKIPLHDNDGKVIGILGTFEDITERVNAEQQLRNAVADAEQANRAKSQFLSRMSHELRTPLNSILGFAQMLMLPTQNSLTELQLSQAQEIEAAGQHLLRLISEVLDFSRIESGEMTLDSEPVDLHSALTEAERLVTDIADHFKIRLIQLAAPEKPLRVYADHLRLRQVLVNLLSNAIQYNRPGGTVRIEHDQLDNGMLKVAIIDTGPGIPEDGQRKLFRPFERLDAVQKGIDGTGIGLVIVRELVELMGGQVGMESTPGQGSTFWFSLPVVAEAELPPALPDQQAEAATPAYVPANPRTVLYVEDNRANFRLIQELLSEHTDYDLVWAESGEQGLITAEQLRPAVVLMDMHMPGLSGTETFSRLQEQPTTRGIPVVALSANALEEDIDFALKLGFQAYLTKPVRIQELLSQLEHYIPPV